MHSPRWAERKRCHDAQRVKRYKARQRGEDVPELKRGAPVRARIVIDYGPEPQPRQLRELQRVTLWNVVTGKMEIVYK